MLLGCIVLISGNKWQNKKPDVKVLFSYPQWYPEVNHFCRGVPLVLIGCKTDLRKDKEQLRKLRAAKQEPITYNQVNPSVSTVVASWQEIKHVMALLLTGMITDAAKLGDPDKEMVDSTNRGFGKFFLEVAKSPPIFSAKVKINMSSFKGHDYLPSMLITPHSSFTAGLLMLPVCKP